MFGLNVTDFIATLALIVSLYGAILSTILFLKEKLKLSLIYLNQNYLSFSKKDDYVFDDLFTHQCYDNNLFSLIIKVRICNNSKSSTTLNEFILNNNFYVDSPSNIDNLIYTKFCKRNNKTIGICSENLKILKPLIVLEPFSSIEGYLIFDNLKEIPSTIKISINTVQKRKTFKLKIKLNDCRKILE